MKIERIFRTCLGIVMLSMIFSLALSAQTGMSYIKGVVKSSSGRPFTSVWVTVSRNGVEKGRSLTGDDGKYYIGNLNGGVYEIVVLQGNRQVYKGQVNLPGDSGYTIVIGST